MCTASARDARKGRSKQRRREHRYGSMSRRDTRREQRGAYWELQRVETSRLPVLALVCARTNLVRTTSSAIVTR